MSTNADAAAQFREIADLLDVLGEAFKPEAYRRASRSIDAMTEDLRAVAARDDLRSIPGVGEAIAEKIREYLASGKIDYYERLRGQVPPGVVALMRLPGLGPKTARRFWTELGIDGPDGLQTAIDGGRLDGVRGFGEKKIAQLRTMLAETHGSSPAIRLPLEVAYPLAHRITGALAREPEVHEVTIAGSFRRGRETVGDLDILVTSDAPEKVFDTFSELPEIREVKMRGRTKETVLLTNGLQADLRVVEPAAFGAALQYFTGSKDHNVRLRSLARDQGLKVNEYGVFRGEERIASRTEEEVYRALGLGWIPPELREDRGEIEIAQRGPVPRLVEAADLQGELHVHLDPAAAASDVERLLEAGRERGLLYLGIVVGEPAGEGTWHSVPAPVIAAIRSGRGATPRPYAVVEVGPGPVPGEALGLEPEYLIVRPIDALASLPELPWGGPPVRLIAHAGGDLAATSAWVTVARGAHAAVEIGPGPERLDSSAARSARENGVGLSVPTGIGEPSESATAAVSLTFARRAGATASEVANARATLTDERRPTRR